MPKIIENLPARLAEEARRQVEESGYDALTVRSVAKGCGVGIGTVYNYYPSKDALVASFLLTDWKHCLERIQSAAETASDPQPVIRTVYDELSSFLEQHKGVFRAREAAAAFSGSFGPYHSLLRSQIALPIRGFCQSDFAAEFIAESLLVWTVSHVPFETLYSILQKLF